jgi:3-dehydroquinate dehydratase type I
MSEIRRNRDAVESAGGADLVEMRLDTVDRPDAAGALDGRRGPVVVTCRAGWEGGYFQGSEEERRRILEEAIAQGADYVDIEARAGFAGALIRERQGRGLVVSSHIFGSMPADLETQWAALRASGAEIAKLAVEARSLADTWRRHSGSCPDRDGGYGGRFANPGQSDRECLDLRRRQRRAWSDLALTPPR